MPGQNHNTPETPPQYPHQFGDGQVTVDDLAHHYHDHVDAYHPAFQPYVDRYLADNGNGFRDEYEDEDPGELADWERELLGIPPKPVDRIAREQPTTPPLLKELLNGNTERQLSDEEARELIDSGYIPEVAQHLDRFSGLRYKTALALFDAGYELMTMHYISDFSSITDDEYGALVGRLVRSRVVGFSVTTEWLNSPRIPPHIQKSIVLDAISRGDSRLYAIAYALDEFTALSRDDKRDILLTIAENGDEYDTLYFAKQMGIRFDYATQKHLMQLFVESRSTANFFDFTDQFDLLTPEDLRDMADEMRRRGKSGLVIMCHDKLPPHSREETLEIVNEAMALDSGVTAVATYLSELTVLNDEDRRVITGTIIDNEGADPLVYSIDTIPGLTHVEYEKAARALLSIKDSGRLVSNLSKFKGLSNELYAELLRSLEDDRKFTLIGRYIDQFPGIDIRSFVLARLQEDDISTLSVMPESALRSVSRDDAIKTIVKERLDRALKYNLSEGKLAVLDILGQNANIEVFDESHRVVGQRLSVVVVELIDHLLHDDAGGRRYQNQLKQLGVTATGREGINQLKEAVDELIKNINRCAFDQKTMELLQNSEVAQSIFIKLTGYDENTEWGSTTEASIGEKVSNYMLAERDGTIEPLADGYVASRVYDIDYAKDTDRRPEWPEDVCKRYSTLRSDIDEALRVLEMPAGFKHILSKLREEAGTILDDIHTSITEIDDAAPGADKKRQNLQRRYDALAQYIGEIDTGTSEARRFVMNSPADFRRGFRELDAYSELHPTMRQLVFAWALRKNPDFVDALEALPATPDIESIATVREFIEHIVNQETYRSYFENKKDAGRFKQLSSTKSLEEAMIRHEQRTTYGNKTQLQFIPTRSVMMEMSGQIAGVCWADTYRLISEEFPNFTSIMMRARPETEDERIVGAAFFIETTDPHTGEKLLVLRGTNPTENYINKVKVSDFYDAIVDYTEQTAHSRGMRPVIVVDDHSGGSGSNRPVLFGHMDKQRKALRPARVDPMTASFNTYDLDGECYYLE